MSVREKVAIELGLISLLTTIFLILFPRRNPVVDVGLAALALIGIGLSAGYTKNTVWAVSPPPIMQNRFKRCIVVTFWVTVPAAVVFLVIGAIIAYESGGWPAVANRVFNWRILAAFCGYLPWALMQQTLLNFFLLGRLLALFPKSWLGVPITITGICFGLVHLPDVWSAAATIVSGIIWSSIYYRYRLLLPLAFSHAALGSAFYFGIFGHDLVAEWQAVLR